MTRWCVSGYPPKRNPERMTSTQGYEDLSARVDYGKLTSNNEVNNSMPNHLCNHILDLSWWQLNQLTLNWKTKLHCWGCYRAALWTLSSLIGYDTTTYGTTCSSLEVVGVFTSITWVISPNAVNWEVIAAITLAITTTWVYNCKIVASVSTDREGPPCVEVEGTSASPCSSMPSYYSLWSFEIPTS